MINGSHLIWIIPTSGMFGFFLAALLAASHDKRDDEIIQTPEKI